MQDHDEKEYRRAYLRNIEVCGQLGPHFNDDHSLKAGESVEALRPLALEALETARVLDAVDCPDKRIGYHEFGVRIYFWAVLPPKEQE